MAFNDKLILTNTKCTVKCENKRKLVQTSHNILTNVCAKIWVRSLYIHVLKQKNLGHILGTTQNLYFRVHVGTPKPAA